MKEVNDIDELEAMLAGLGDDELNQLEELDAPTAKSAPVTDPDVSDAELIGEIEDEPTPAATKPPARKKRLKPLPEDEPKPEVSDEDAELAALAELDDAPAPEVKPEPVAEPEPEVANPGTGASAAEIVAEQVIDLLTVLPEQYGLSADDDLSAIFDPILNRITENSKIHLIEKALRKALVKHTGNDPFLVDAMQEALDAVVELPKEPVVVEPEPVVVAEEPKGDDEPTDEELEALLAAVPEVAPAPKAAVTSPSKPVSVTPTKKAGGLNTFIDADQLQRDLHFTELTINDGMTRQAALFAHYARLSADATYQSDRAKQQVELLEATLNQRFRDSMVAAGTKFTEKAIDAMVIQDSSYQAAQERAHEAKAIASMVASAADSFRHRKDMLIQVGADLRLEKQGELRMKAHPGQSALDNLEK
ncbi:hypothetical protein phiK7B1_062 [Pseudomonas phage phiK7B1]|nr:hypothetical protein phiK7B1_062 [Pseudomonas phage phiK7B1]